jgi:pimeloyl-ACP methyl ester carboxylesterase
MGRIIALSGRVSPMPTITANGAELYYEVRGIGPSLLLIHGGGGDAGTVTKLAQSLAQDFTVVVYDRRGLSRSRRPKEWRQTSIAEQADDAAGLVAALGAAPAAVVGHSLGALIALELLLRHPELVRRAALLDPGPLDSAIPDRAQKMAMPDGVRAAMAKGGAEAGFEALLRNLHIWDQLDPPARRRALGNTEVFFNYETPLLQRYRPDDILMGTNRVPVQVGAGEDTPPVFREMAEWLAARLGVRVEGVPGGHASCVEYPEGVAEMIRPFLLHATEDRATFTAPNQSDRRLSKD